VVLLLYGWRARIGLIVPSSNTTCEGEFYKMKPKGISIHTSRCKLAEKIIEKEKIGSIIEMNKNIFRAADEITTTNPDIIVWACTTGSFIKGMGYDKELQQLIYKRTNIRSITTSTAVINALKTIKVKKISMLTPYIEKLTRLEEDFLKASIPNLEICKVKSLGILSNIPKGNIFPEEVYKLVKSIDCESAEAIFISCTNLRAIEVIEILEKDLNKPVLSSVQASFWLALKELKIPAKPGFGSLFSYI